MSNYTKGYTAHDWENDEVITEASMDHLENGVADAHAWLADLESNIPTYVSDLTNDSGFLNATEVQALIDAALNPEEEIT